MSHPIETLSLDGGWLCLDFTNTVSTRLPATGDDYLHSWDDFAVWVARVDLLPETEYRIWKRMPPGDIAEPRALRELIYGLFSHYAEKGVVHPGHLEALNGYLHEVYAHTRICMTGNGLRRGVEDEPHLEKPLWLIALSAETLLLSDRLSRVKACDNCGWLFLDTSKNGARRWCNMSTCGSQIKAKAWYHRKKKAAQRGAGKGRKGKT
ncbi:MAG: CGNR zinc finger domain-containing protein [Lewinellaceae bacterium]|nr:CGNR zinc finger domain-containing protein [Lewinellaceae bacterium]